ncbi:16S rRNA (uracil(1498)-N(3))-methyltransferase [Mycoplasma sp. 128]
MRFIVNKKENNYFILDQETIHHLRVARQFNKTFICVYENEFYQCRYEDQKAYIIEKLDLNHEFSKPVGLAVSLINWKNFELILQKATELGVSHIYPFKSRYSEMKVDDFENKRKRFEKIIFEACQQSFRNKIPSLSSVLNFEDVLAIKDFDHRYIAHEKNQSEGHKFFLPSSLFLIGPEGGFSDEEVNKAIHAGFESIKLTKTILRAETAALYVIAKVHDE